jgi:hypothetical protein
MINWDRTIAKTPDLYLYLQQTIENLPRIFNKSYFRECLLSLKYDSGKNVMKLARDVAKRASKKLPLPAYLMEKMRGKKHVISPSALILRSVVLSRWHDLWIEQ